MSINKMLIDATHPEETRVVVLKDSRVEEFDYESAARKLLRGSIYLAKITRVEPSLQAAFVDYGGNRHGFLAFSEIHPDYYQIPHADKVALLEAEERAQAEYEAQLDLEDEDEAHASGEDAGHEHEDETDDQLVDAAQEDEFDAEANAIDVSHLLPDPDEASEYGSETADSSEESVDQGEAAASPSSESTEAANRAGAAAEAGRPSSAASDEADGAAVSQEQPAAAEAEAEPNDTDRPRSMPAAIENATDVLQSTGDVDAHVHISSGDVAEIELKTSDETDEGDAVGQPGNFVEARADSEETDEDDVVESLNETLADDDDETIASIDDDGDDSDEDEDDDRPRPQSNRPQRPRRRPRQYKIQEVIKRRQIVLIQVVKEERGNKGAALTTYLSLAGRYTVLMPNTARGGGISRKITNMQDRKRLKAIAQELDVPEGMGLIIRTAGAARTKQEIKRDFEYLLRLWENVRNLTLESTAPCLVYEEGNLIKRSIRDLYTKEIDEVVVAGDTAHKEAKGFMRMLMPSHAKNVVKHEAAQSLFGKFRIEQQLNAMFSPNVQLKSGGYLVINQTEALVAIDVNSGKSTREFSIEETALNTNLEAAEELARQLKLRDLAGLIVIDFIDMEEKRNNRAVERKLKDALKADRARIQVGRISHFGLLEMSRQRLRTGVLEGSTTPCEHCQGTGIVRSIESVALAVLRGLEDALITGRASSCAAHCASDVALYLLNQKRAFIQELEERYSVTIHVRSSLKHQGANFSIEPLQDAVERIEPRAAVEEKPVARRRDSNDDEAEADSKPRRRRRRRERRDDQRDQAETVDENAIDTDDLEADDEEAIAATSAEDEGGEERPRRSRRRGRRGGRRHRDQRARSDDVADPGAEQPFVEDHNNADGAVAATAESVASQPEAAAEAGDVADTSSQNAQPNEQLLAVAEVSAPAASETEASEGVSTAQNGSDAPDAQDEQQEEVQALAKTEAVEEAREQVAESEPAPALEVTEAASEAADAGAADRSARSQPVASEPVIQHRVIGPNGTNGATREATAAESEAVEEETKPSRRGWWQRQFGV